MPFGIQPIHILIIIIVALLVFGPKKLPDLGRSIGKMLSEFRNASKEMTDNFRQEANQPNSQTISPTIATPPVSVPTASGFTPAAPAIPSTDGEKIPSPAATAGRFCIQCGAPNLLEARFCGNCGSKLPEKVV
jgi:sec-independent protein translocase protein TatA